MMKKSHGGLDFGTSPVLDLRGLNLNSLLNYIFFKFNPPMSTSLMSLKLDDVNFVVYIESFHALNNFK